MRLLLVADLHYALPHYDWVTSVAGDFDAVVLAGDLADVASPVGIDAQIIALRATLGDIAQQSLDHVRDGSHLPVIQQIRRVRCPVVVLPMPAR